jgi:murein DD-endopeptidase MepM/ murein hydrolase activator NlpD
MSLSRSRGILPPILAVLALCGSASSALAIASAPGGVQAPSASAAGGSEYGVVTRVAPTSHPVLSALTAPSSAIAGPPPKVMLRLDEKGVGTVYLQVKIISLATHHSVVVATMGWSHTARTLAVAWPVGAQLSPGSYEITVSAHDHRGATLPRLAHSSGQATLTVKAPPAPSAPVSPAPLATSEPGVPTPAQTVADGAVFPVAGAHSFGGPENRFGAAREGHVHQGQDVLTAEGTPVLAPMAGTIESTSYQPGGAGYYAVEHTSVGLDFMFAHCEANSFAVGAGQAVTAGQALCKAGQTGDATAPHLHFEMWVGGWQASGGHPIDPLPYLEAWEHG